MRVILPDSGTGLLRRELAAAFDALGWQVRQVGPSALTERSSTDFLPRLLDAGADLFFSVNLQGLLPGGEVPATLRTAGVPVLAWFVDNPWHVLSAMRDPSWKHFNLAVTDSGFIEPLAAALREPRAKGEAESGASGGTVSAVSSVAAPAAGVLHFPLAACPSCMEQSRAYAAVRPGFAQAGFAELVFAGRSVFPERDSFFAGLDLPPELLAEAGEMSYRGERADFAWWVEKLGLPRDQTGFWPGRKARRPGLGAAESNRVWRLQRLAAAVPAGLTLFGDEGWLAGLKSIGAGLPDLRPGFDYYARLYEVYSRASFSLNLNSLLMGAGLSQRIFDVWLAGGFCLTDNSPGLDIFPVELTGPVTFAAPRELPELAAFFRERPARKRELRQAWRECILTRHTYAERLRDLLPRILPGAAGARSRDVEPENSPSTP